MTVSYHICPACGSKRLKSLSKRLSYYCPKCKSRFSIIQEPVVSCFKCKKPIIDPVRDGTLMGNGKYKHIRCRKTVEDTK